MKTTSLGLLALTTSLATSSAATITANPGDTPDSAGYAFHMALDSSDHDTTSFFGTVGSWSWEDSSLGDDVGWRHQSQWIAITLVEDSRLDIDIQRLDIVDDAKFFPSFTLFNNHTNNNGPHLFQNKEDLVWDSSLTYVGHITNTSEGAITGSYILPAGDYTLVLGGNAISEALPVSVNYIANLTAIPEPSSIMLGLLAGVGTLIRRRR